ncbi:TetR/AcrR family transcriptional regulator [Endozoicomonas arenosclerae]|uniref:TetR/AcrR family transcriptional regulator n=1 Tax=Endozoicomonas arenosclerae TaxID=1633495 RepID=UPI000784DF9E|nr:TetR/AcrR family transcriptional regulator [Endozoicomonas arenosclerae]
MKAARKDTLTTRQNLTDAAEKLFAEKGIDNVSLVDISRAAGQKNRCALQYHFGDKIGLINAVLDKHSKEIDHARGEMLDELIENGECSLRDAVCILVKPLAKRVELSEGGKAFLSINSQMMSSTQYADLRVQRVPLLPDTQRLSSIFKKKIKVNSPDEFHARMLIVDCMLFHSLSAYSSRAVNLEWEAFIETLIDSITAVVER